jgi:hypothetical protein
MKNEQAEIPVRMRALPRDPDRPHFPVPWFVAWIAGKPDFRVIEAGKIVAAVRYAKCWLCGQRLGSVKTFVIGPMCAVNRVSSEPPCHLDCAEYAVKVCPFLTQPKMRRNEKGLPEDRQEAAGIAIPRNPGASLLWSTLLYTLFPAPGGGILFHVGEPYKLSWWAEGRAATREEVLASLESGYPILREMANPDDSDELEYLERAYQKALALVPRGLGA